jgi:hypothetical protein
MAHMISAAGLSAKLDIAFYGAPLALGTYPSVAMLAAVAPVVDVSSVQERIVFAVGGDDHVFGRGSPHGFPHHFLALDAAAVIRKGDAPALEGVEINQFQSTASFRDGTVGEHPDKGVPVYGFQFYGEMLRTVRHGIQVGHGAYEGVSTPGSGPTATADGFLPGLSRFTEMYVKVGECG